MNTNLITFAHISKCAGTTVTRTLLPHLQPAFEIHFRQQDLYFLDMIRDLPQKKYRYVYGHFWHRQLDMLKVRNIPHFAFSFIRHPIERIISHYRFDKTPAVPWYKMNIQKYRCFEEYCFGVQNNYLAFYLVGDVSSLDEYIEKAESRFDFIGASEHFDKSMVRLCEKIGVPFTPIPDQNVTTKTRHNDEEIKRETIDRLAEIHALDIQFWEYIMKKYETGSN